MSPRDHAGVFTDRPDDLVVGVLGGMGPYATADFFRRLVALTPAAKDWDHLHIVVDDNPRMPSRSRAFLFGEASPVPYLIAGAQRLVRAGAQLIAVPCNSASYFLAPVRAAVPIPILDPVLATSRAIAAYAPRPRRPLVLGGAVTHEARLYGDVERPDDDGQAAVVAAIEALKLDRGSPELVARLDGVIEDGRARGADAVVLACTELGWLVGRLATSLPVFDSNEELARSTVSVARRVAAP